MVYCESPATLRLESWDATGATLLESLDLMDEANGYRVSSVDIGFPAVREVVAALPTRDGDYDTTRLLGPRTVTVAGWFVPSAQGPRQQAWQALAHWVQPRLRPRLVYQIDPAVAPVTLGLRGANLSGPFTNPQVSEFQVSWVAPDPVARGLVQHSQIIQPQSSGTVGGRAYSLTFSRTYPAPSPGGSGIGTVTNAGDYPTWPLFRVFGPCTDPAIWWVTPAGPAVVFAGLTVAGGDYVEVDTNAQTANVNGDPNASRYAQLDFTRTRWQAFFAGDTTIRFAPATWSAPCQLLVLWNDATL